SPRYARSACGAHQEIRLLLRRDDSRPVRVLHSDQHGTGDPPEKGTGRYRAVVRRSERGSGPGPGSRAQPLPPDQVVPSAALDHGGHRAAEQVRNPRTQEMFVLLRVDEYERLKEDEYDDTPWTREELQALAWEVAERTDWEEYDDAPEKP